MEQPRPTIYLEADDDLSQVIWKINRIKAEQFVLVVPRGALLMHSPLNLKVLKRYLDERQRTAHIAIADKIGETFAEQAGFILASTAPAGTDETTMVVEGAQINRFDEDLPESPEISLEEEIELDVDEIELADIPETPLPIQRGLGKSRVDFGTLMRPPQLTQFKLRLTRQHKITLGLVGLGLVMLGSVGYFIVPRADIKLEVQSEPFAKQFALILADEQDLQSAGANILAGRFLEVSRENVATFSATGEKNNGQKSEGKITVVNHTGSIAGLLANTRFQADNGLVFRIKNEILVPAARNNSPGRATVDAISDEGGTKYNVAPGLKLSIPGLAGNAQALVYGEVSTQFTGATDEITKIVSQEDIDKAKEEAAKNVFAAAEAELTKQLKRDEEILPSFIQNDVVDAIPSVTAGAFKETFEVRVQSRSWVVAIHKGDLNFAIANAAAFEVPEGKQITARTVETAEITTVEGNFLTHRINLLVAVDGRVGPQIDANMIVTHLVNQTPAVAKDYLQSLPNIASSSVTIWPSFIPRLPLISNNLKLEVIYLGE